METLSLNAFEFISRGRFTNMYFIETELSWYTFFFQLGNHDAFCIRSRATFVPIFSLRSFRILIKFHVVRLLAVAVLGLAFSTKLVGILRGFFDDTGWMFVVLVLVCLGTGPNNTARDDFCAYDNISMLVPVLVLVPQGQRLRKSTRTRRGLRTVGNFIQRMQYRIQCNTVGDRCSYGCDLCVPRLRIRVLVPGWMFVYDAVLVLVPVVPRFCVRWMNDVKQSYAMDVCKSTR